MSFKILSKNGLHEKLPSDIQEYIADIVINYKYKLKFNDIMLELIVELSTGSSMPINNVEKTFVEILYDKLVNFPNQDYLNIIISKWMRKIQNYTDNNICIGTLLFETHLSNPQILNYDDTKSINKCIILQLSYQELLDLVRYTRLFISPAMNLWI